LHIVLATLNPLFKGRLHQPQPWWLMGAVLINFEVREKLHLACKENKFVVEVEGVGPNHNHLSSCVQTSPHPGPL
jgi:hypothetical protein